MYVIKSSSMTSVMMILVVAKSSYISLIKIIRDTFFPSVSVGLFKFSSPFFHSFGIKGEILFADRIETVEIAGHFIHYIIHIIKMFLSLRGQLNFWLFLFAIESLSRS